MADCITAERRSARYNTRFYSRCGFVAPSRQFRMVTQCIGIARSRMIYCNKDVYTAYGILHLVYTL